MKVFLLALLVTSFTSQAAMDCGAQSVKGCNQSADRCSGTGVASGATANSDGTCSYICTLSGVDTTIEGCTNGPISQNSGNVQTAKPQGIAKPKPGIIQGVQKIQKRR
jgi:hypothetical protein